MKKRILILGIFIGLICSNFFIFNASADSAATISITIYRIQKIDEIENAWLLQGEADWFYHVGVSNDGGNTFIWQHSDEPIQADTDDLIVNEIHIFTDITSTTVTIAIMLCEDDYGASDIADVSSDSSDGFDGVEDSIQPPNTGYYGGTYIGSYNLKTNTLSGHTTYVEEGYYKTSGDYDGSTDTDENDASVWFDILDNYDSPSAYFSISDSEINAGEKVNFDASGSTASVDIDKYQWDFESDGIWDAEGETTNYIYNDAGSYSVQLRVTDVLGETDTTIGYVTVTSNPIAAFVYSPSNPTTLDIIQFTDTSTITGGTLASWAWNFGDEITSTDRNPTHQYSQGDTYYVTLTVTADDNQKDTTYEYITIIELSDITGTVKDASDNPISGATIKLYEAGTSTIIATTTTNSNGEYSISEMPSDTYDIESFKSGYDNNKKTNKIIYAGENTVDFVLSDSDGRGGTPGFELILVVCAIAFVLLIRRYGLN